MSGAVDPEHGRGPGEEPHPAADGVEGAGAGAAEGGGDAAGLGRDGASIGGETLGGSGEAVGGGAAVGGGELRSGLRNPAAAVRGVGAGALAVEAIVLLMAIVPLIKIGGSSAGSVVTVILVLAVACVLLAGLLRYRWAWYAGIVLQVALLASGVVHVALAVLGLLFGAVWGYVLSVRRSVLGRI